METQTAFDLNLAIRRWREDLARFAAFRRENLNELESHLRDSIDRLRARELSDEESFLIATRRMGGAQRLEREFGKVNVGGVWFDRFLWVVMAIPLWSIVSSMSFLLWYLLIFICQWCNQFLPGFDLPTIGVSRFESGLVVGLFPIPIALAVVLISRYFFLPTSKGSLLIGKLLHRPVALALTMFLLCAVIEFSQLWFMQHWYYPTVLHLTPARGFLMGFFPIQFLMLGFWAALTFFAARKRLRASLA